ncbi:hypothetical protein CAL65_12010 [Alkalilimnicola ehrlichii]|uniref:Uncharacterized protein n=1 Tax=Alkalilimnicola ehrlichii TaxID=351052 RepID=A0A3E0WT67_9GAMM|nr:hypothetical protein CAL65_12010 [Alkalilimnicola ehrlichii]
MFFYGSDAWFVLGFFILILCSYVVGIKRLFSFKLLQDADRQCLLYWMLSLFALNIESFFD